jgi:hypothetical protein
MDLRIARVVAVVIIAVAELGRPLDAYLDPDTGSIAVQATLAAIAAAAVLVKMNWPRLRGWMTRRPRQSPDGD